MPYTLVTIDQHNVHSLNFRHYSSATQLPNTAILKLCYRTNYDNCQTLVKLLSVLCMVQILEFFLHY